MLRTAHNVYGNGIYFVRRLVRSINRISFRWFIPHRDRLQLIDGNLSDSTELSWAINIAIMQTKTTKTQLQIHLFALICAQVFAACKFTFHEHIPFWCIRVLGRAGMRTVFFVCILFARWRKRGDCNYSSSASPFLPNDRRKEMDGWMDGMCKIINWKKSCFVYDRYCGKKIFLWK